jgi:beta-N-acetylhexosaminidase
VNSAKEMLAPPADAPLRKKLAQLMFVRIGSNLPPVRTVEEDEERVAALLQEVPVGGLCAFNGSYAKTPRTLERLQKRSRYPLLISADLERGAGQQLRGHPVFPHAMAFDALGAGAAEAVYQFARLTGEASRAAGVHINYAPTADVNSDPRNPIISTRAFGTEPARVAELVAAFVRGCGDAGLLSAAKHFPGHGNTHEDSHHAQPAVEASREVLMSRDLPPFKAAIEAGVPLVMTAHVRYPSLDSAGRTATHSRPIVDLLRNELGFTGAVITDSLLMEGVKIGSADEAEVALKSLQAGVDILLDVASPALVLDALVGAVTAGKLDESRVDEALGRVRKLKEQGFGWQPVTPFSEVANREQTESQAADVARRSTVVLRNERGLLPFRNDRSLCAILVNPFPLPSNADPPPLGEYLRRSFSNVDYFELGAEPRADELERIEQIAAKCEQLLAAFVVKPAAWHHFGLPTALREWLQKLATHRPLVAACLGALQGLEPLSSAAAQICTFSDVPVSQMALVEALLAAR